MALVNAMLSVYVSTYVLWGGGKIDGISMYWMRQDMSRAFAPTVNQHVPPEMHSATRQMSSAAQGGSPTISVAADQGTPQGQATEKGDWLPIGSTLNKVGLSSRLARLMLAP